jgi:tetratricopeptide (TPR) repeat protein
LGIPRNPEQAVQQLEQALKEDPANARNETFLARDLALCGRAAEAVRHAKHAAELAPEDELALQTWGRLAFRLNDYKEAVAAGRQALSLDPTDSQTHYKMGLALMRLGQVPEAARHFAAIVDAQPTWADAQFELGLCLLYQPGQRSQGLAHLKEAVRLDPANSAWQEVLQKALAGR